MEPTTKKPPLKKEEKQEKQEIAKHESSHSERFTNMVVKEFGANAPGQKIELTAFQRKLIQNYFIKIDQTLKDAEKKRLAKSEKNRDPVSLEWKNVNMQKLALDVIAHSAVGLDPAQPNHINIMPYKNKHTSLYDMGFVIGYNGLELKGRKYGLDVPDSVTVELVWSNDKFVQIKKDSNNPFDTYVFEVTEPFNRGEIVGGFYYHEFKDNPSKNRLKVMTKEDIEKRKPEYASVEFWGGEKDKWENNQKVGKEQVEGWYEEMCYKTVKRAAWNAVTIDSEKIDEHFRTMAATERDALDARVQADIQQNANKEEIGFTDVVDVTEKTETAPAANGQTEEERKEAAKLELGF